MKAISLNDAWFSFNGVRNDAFAVRMLSMPTRPHPARKGTYTEVPGRNGRQWMDEDAYDQISIPVHCMAPDNDQIDQISAWLSGSGDLIFGDEPGRVYRANITEEFARNNRSQLLHGQEFTVSFDCEPFRYNVNPFMDLQIYPHDPAYGDTHSKITNPGNVESMPLIAVDLLYTDMVESGDYASISIGDKKLIFSSPESAITVFVDCDAKIAYTGAGTDALPEYLVTHLVGGEWITIPPGTSDVIVSGNIGSVTVRPRWRWL